MGTNISEGAIVYLLEDALDLWLAVLEYSPAMTNELMQLFNNMPSLLGRYSIHFTTEWFDLFNLN